MKVKRYSLLAQADLGNPPLLVVCQVYYRIKIIMTFWETYSSVKIMQNPSFQTFYSTNWLSVWKKVQWRFMRRVVIYAQNLLLSLSRHISNKKSWQVWNGS